MYYLKKGFNFYIFGNIHVALAAFCLTKISLAEFGAGHDAVAYFVFFATILSYNFIGIVQNSSINTGLKGLYMLNKKSLILLNAISLLGLIILSFDFGIAEILILLPFVLSALFYVAPWSSRFKGLRNIPGLKLFLISFTWAGVTVYFPLFVAQIDYSATAGFVFLQRFLFVLAISIPFDIRDAEFDLPELGTLPQVIGIEKSKIIAVAAMIVFVFLEVYKKDFFDQSFYITLFIALISIIAILGAGGRQKRFYSSFWVEGIPILWFFTLTNLL